MAELLADHTTFRVGGPAGRFVVATTEADLIATVSAADAVGEPVLILGGGSNVLVSDDGFPGTVVQVATRGSEITGGVCTIDEPGAAQCGGAVVTVAAGESWDGFVARTVEQEWWGVEALSGIPGTVGSAPIQNIGAYGQEAGQTLWNVRTWDRVNRGYRTFPVGDCGLGYRTSVFKREPGRYVVLEVTFQFRQGDLGAPVRYPELARALGVAVGERVPARDVREAVLALRRSKGMVLDSSDHDTWSAGSFFTNPIVTLEQAARLPADAPRYAAGPGLVKMSAAWLIQHAGFQKGYGVPPATLSTKHTLALTNRGGARTADILALAREIRGGVVDAFGVVLEPEAVLVGCSLD